MVGYTVTDDYNSQKVAENNLEVGTFPPGWGCGNGFYRKLIERNKYHTSPELIILFIHSVISFSVI